MRYLITGGAGFIGGHLTETLARQGHTVTVLDRRPPPSEVMAAGDVTVVLDDIRTTPQLDPLVRAHDAVFHLAAVVGFANVMQHPVQTLTTGMVGSARLLESCARQGRRILFTSTSAVYGRTTDSQRPVREEEAVLLGPTGVRSWSYAYSKAAEEALAFAYHQTYDLSIVVTRLFNVVGPRQSAGAGFVLPRFIRAAQDGDPIHVHAPGTQTRTFAHVADVVEGMIALLQCEAATGQVVNLGGTATSTMYDLACTVRDQLGSTSPVEVVPDPYGAGYENVAHRVPCLERAAKLIGYTPRLGLSHIIAHMMTDVAVTV